MVVRVESVNSEWKRNRGMRSRKECRGLQRPQSLKTLKITCEAAGPAVCDRGHCPSCPCTGPSTGTSHVHIPWTARRSNQSILKEIGPGCSLGGLMLKLRLQYFGHLMRRVDSLEKTLMLGGIERRRGRQRMRWLDGITDSMDMSLSEPGSW